MTRDLVGREQVGAIPLGDADLATVEEVRGLQHAYQDPLDTYGKTIDLGGDLIEAEIAFHVLWAEWTSEYAPAEATDEIRRAGALVAPGRVAGEEGREILYRQVCNRFGRIPVLLSEQGGHGEYGGLVVKAQDHVFGDQLCAPARREAEQIRDGLIVFRAVE